MFVWRAENSLWESVLSFNHASSRDQTQLLRLGGRWLDLLSHLMCFGPRNFFLLLIICVNVWVWVCARERSASRAQKKVSSPWSWSCRQFWTARCGCWEPNCGPLQKQAVLLTKEHLSSPHVYILIRWDLVSDNKTFNVSFLWID